MSIKHNSTPNFSGEYGENVTKLVDILLQKQCLMLLCLNMITTAVLDPYIFKNINIIMFENFQGINPKGLGAPLDEYSKPNTSQR